MDERFLETIQGPSRFLGREVGAVRKDPATVSAQALLLFPDHYDLGMCHWGYKLIYHALNREPDLLCERAFCPEPALEAVLRREGRGLLSLESGRPMAEFDLVGLTMPHELAATNLLTLLDLGGVSLLAGERGEAEPLVLAGGPGVFNPEPLADFLDAVFLGDGEEAAPEILRAIGQGRREGASRAQILERLARLAGVYVPAQWRPSHAEGRFQGMVRVGGGTAQPVARRVAADLNRVFVPPGPIVPFGRPVQDRLTVEVARGCTRGCRFCQAGMVYRPVRERRPKELLDQTLTALRRTGYDELSLLALSADDYSCLQPFLQALMDRLDQERVAVSLPSLRADTLTQETAELIRRVRATGFTLAPEAGSERLRAAINKNLSQADILAAAGRAAAAGWRLLKLYFMVGLPTETDEDLVALVELVKLLVRTNPALRLNVSLAGFVPKAHTPFQWAAQQPAEEIDRRMGLIKAGLRRLSAVRVKWNSPEVSQLDGLLSRGDRSLGRVILGAWRRGARFEAWSEHFRLAPWAEALAEAGLSLADRLGPRDPAAPLPWEHLQVVDRGFLLAEWTKALAGGQTPDCRTAGCQGCGVCDFETIQPVTFVGLKFSAPAPARPKDKPRRLALNYHKLGPARFLGHLEMALVFHRAFRRAGLRLAYSQGFHPQPRVSFLGALPVGAESLDEWAEVELLDHRPPGEIMKLLNKELPLGLSLTSLALGPARLKPRAALYRLSLAEAAGPALERDRVAAFLAAAEVPFERRRPDKTQRLDLRPAVEELRLVYDAEVEMVLDLTREGATPKPEEVAAAVFGRPAGDFRVLKLKTLMAGEKP